MVSVRSLLQALSAEATRWTVLQLARFVINPVDEEGRVTELTTTSDELLRQASDDPLAWALEQMDLAESQPRDIVDRCMQSMSSKLTSLGVAKEPLKVDAPTFYADLKVAVGRLSPEQRASLEKQTEDEIHSSMRSFQLQPVMHESYRRFVVVSSSAKGLGSTAGPLSVSGSISIYSWLWLKVS